MTYAITIGSPSLTRNPNLIKKKTVILNTAIQFNSQKWFAHVMKFITIYHCQTPHSIFQFKVLFFSCYERKESAKNHFLLKKKPSSHKSKTAIIKLSPKYLAKKAVDDI